MSAVIVENYISSLTKLTINSKPYIIRLTTLAEEFIEHAPAIVEAIESHLKKVKPEIKLPALYLIDSIVKNVEQPYLGLFSKNIVNTFCKVFKKVDENTRASMWKLRQTWNNIFPAKKLFALDVRVHNIDPAWHITPLPNNNVSTVDSRESQISIGAENTVDLKLQENVVDSNNQKSIVNKVSSETSENVISSRSLNETQESFEITSSQLIDSIKEEFHFEDQKPSILNGDIITIDDFDNELKPNIKLEENNEDDITSEIFDTLMNNEILLEWDVIKDKHLIKFILNNPDNLQKDCTYKKLLMLEPQIFEGFKPENLRKRKDHLANDYEYLIKLCGFEKIKTEQEKVIFDKRIESLRKLMNFSIKMEVD